MAFLQAYQMEAATRLSFWSLKEESQTTGMNHNHDPSRGCNVEQSVRRMLFQVIPVMVEPPSQVRQVPSYHLHTACESKAWLSKDQTRSQG